MKLAFEERREKIRMRRLVQRIHPTYKLRVTWSLGALLDEFQLLMSRYTFLISELWQTVYHDLI